MERSGVKYLDALVRAIVFDRDRHRCVRCGSAKRAGRGGGLQAAHIFPKGQFPGVRWELRNVVAMCASCHVYGPDAWHKHPIAAVEWARTHFGDHAIDELRFLALTRKTIDREALRIYLENECERLQIPPPASR